MHGTAELGQVPNPALREQCSQTIFVERVRGLRHTRANVLDNPVDFLVVGVVAHYVVAMIFVAGPVEPSTVSRNVIRTSTNYFAIRRGDDCTDLSGKLPRTEGSTVCEKHRVLVARRGAERVAKHHVQESIELFLIAGAEKDIG
jgi:hypothetical protein